MGEWIGVEFEGSLIRCWAYRGVDRHWGCGVSLDVWYEGRAVMCC